MSDDPNAEPVPTLNYYKEDQSAALRLLVRLIMLAGAANGLLNAISFGGGILPPWALPQEPIDLAILIGQVLAWLAVAVLCFLFLASRRGRVILVATQVAALLLDVCYFVRQILQTPEFGNTAVMLTAIVSDWLIPALLIVVLLRTDMRPTEPGPTEKLKLT